MKLNEAIAEIRKEEKRKFEQSVDLIINLKGIDPKKESVNVVLALPHKIKEKIIGAFLTQKSNLVDTITEPEFKNYKGKKDLRKLVKHYDYFIAVAPLMPKVATAFGKVLGPAGKMPSPQLGIIAQENENEIKKVLEKISSSLKIRVKEASVKLVVGRENMSDKEIIENTEAVYKAVEAALPKKRDGIRSVMIKLTMGKPARVEM